MSVTILQKFCIAVSEDLFGNITAFSPSYANTRLGGRSAMNEIDTKTDREITHYNRKLLMRNSTKL